MRLEADGAQGGEVGEVAAVEEEGRLFHDGVDAGVVGVAGPERVPLGEQRHGVGAGGGGVGVGVEGHARAGRVDTELGADNVYAWAKEQAGEVSHEMFGEWMHRNGLSLTTAAEALGISRRMVSDYRTAHKAIPRTIWLACLGWEATQPKANTLPRYLPTAREYAAAHN